MLFSASSKLGSSALSHKREPVDSCEADWVPYLDEKCIKVFDKMDIFDKAEEYCGVQNANGESGRLVTVASTEEQNFLVNYLFKEKKISDSVWLGALLSDNETEHFSWHREGGQTDQLTYSNWRSNYPKLSGSKADSDDNGNCVQMIGGINEGRGEWINEPCNKNNRIVCEKRQVWSSSKMQELLEKLARLQDVLEKTVQENFETVKSLVSIPIGFIYVQLPNEKAPEEIWPSDWYSWTEVSDAYAGVFFRVVGGDAADFGNTQDDNAPRIDEVKRSWCQLKEAHGNCTDNSMKLDFKVPDGSIASLPVENIQISAKEGWSSPVWTVRTYGEAGDATFGDVHFYHVSGGEVRPRNMAVKVWKRTG